MSTGKEFANLVQYKQIGYKDFGDKFLDYLRDFVKDSLSRIWDSPYVLMTPMTISSLAANTIKIAGSSWAVDGNGNFFKWDDSSVDSDNFQFENSIGAVYHVALKKVIIPISDTNMEINVRTGYPVYASWKDEIGESAAPDSVVDNGSTLTFVVDSVTEAAVTNVGREVIVYKNDPGKGATTAAIAIETCTVTWDGSNNKITTTALLGQTTPSTTASDYTVVCLGPKITKNTDTSETNGYVYLGTVTGNGGTPTVFDTTEQPINYITISLLNEMFQRESNGKLKIYIQPASDEDNIQQILVEDVDGDMTFSLDEKGLLKLFGFPVIRTTGSAKTHVNQWYDDTHIKSTKPSRCVTTGYIDGHKKLFLFDSTGDGNLYVETWDLETVTRDSIDSLTGKVLDTATDTIPVSAFVDDGYVYVAYLSDSLTNQTVQAFDIETWAIKTGWPSTGVTTTTDIAVTSVDVGRLLLDYNKDSFLMLRINTDVPVNIISKDDGSTLDQGCGDSIDDTDYAPLSMAVSGEYVFWTANSDTGTDARIFSAKLSDLTTGSGLSDFPHACITGIFKFGTEFEVCNGCFIGSTAVVDRFYMLARNGGQERLIDPTFDGLRNFKIYHLTQDGANFWFSGSMRTSSSGDFKPTLFRFNHLAVFTPGTDDPDNIRDTDIITSALTPFVVHDNTDWGANVGTTPTSFLFDGSDIVIVNPSSSPAGHIYRITNALFRHSSAAIPSSEGTGADDLIEGRFLTEVFTQAESEMSMSDSNNWIDAGTSRTTDDMYVAIISGSQKVLEFDRTAQVIYVSDAATMLPDTSIDFVSDLLFGFDTTGTQDWELMSICVDEEYLYCLARDNDASPKEYQLQAFSLGNYAVRVGWSTYGTLIGTQSVTPDDNFVKVKNATVPVNGKLFIAQPYKTITLETDSALVIVDKTDGSIDGTGAGDFGTVVPTYSGVITHAQSNGVYIFYLYHESTNNDIWLMSMSIASPGATGSITAADSQEITADHTQIKDMAVCGRTIAILLSNGTTCWVVVADEVWGQYLALTIEDVEVGRAICSDGRYFWVRVFRDLNGTYNGENIIKLAIGGDGIIKDSEAIDTSTILHETWMNHSYRTGIFEEDDTYDLLSYNMVADNNNVWLAFSSDSVGEDAKVLRLRKSQYR